MTVRALLVAALLFSSVFSIGAASAAPKFSGDDSPALTVRAGVGGAARPGRWLPVQATVTAGDTGWRGTLTAEWGGARAHTLVDLTPASTATVKLFLRTIGASPAVRVTLSDANGHAGRQVDTPLVLLPVDGPARVCIGDADASAACDVRVSAEDAPTNWRAFDLADTVTTTSREDSLRPVAASVRPESARAQALWRAARRWQDSGFVDPVSAPFDMDSRLADRTAAGLTLFAAVLLVAVVIVTARRSSVLLAAALPMAVSIAGVVVVTRSSREADLQASSFVHQFAGVDQSLVFMRGEIEHPGGSALTLAPDIDEGSVDVETEPQVTDSATTPNGVAVYDHIAGRGSRVRFELTGSLNKTWLAVTLNSAQVVVENHSPYSLRDCQLRTSDIVAIGDVAAGAMARAPFAGAIADGDAVICKLPADWLQWTAPQNPVVTRGSAYVILHLQPATATPMVLSGTR